MNDAEIKLQPMPKVKRLGEGLNEETSNYCEICERTFIGELQWQLHLKSNKHKKTKTKLNRQQEKTKSD
jgi:tRNA dimethylallyltransferase